MIIQRFDLGRWGLFTEFEGSEIHPVRRNAEEYVLKATFARDAALKIYLKDQVYSGINLIGRSTNAVGARKMQAQELDEQDPVDSSNDLIVKFSWPEGKRASEVDIIDKATQIGEGNPLVKGHIPTIIGNIDPPYLTCSTSFVRKSLGLDTNGSRVLRVIAFPRLMELKHLEEEDMLMAYLECFFCGFLQLLLGRVLTLRL